MVSFESDAIDDFWERQGEHGEAGDRSGKGSNRNIEGKGNGDNYEGDTVKEREPTLFAIGARHGQLEVVGRDDHKTLGALGRWRVTKRVFLVHCHGCSRDVRIPYVQFYNGGNILQNCGCKPKFKHPPYRFEGQRIGLVEVVEWDEAIGEWLMVCGECGAMIYRRTRREVLQAGDDCGVHVVVHSSPLKTRGARV